MQKIRKTQRVHPEKNGQTNRWTEEQDRFYRIASAKMEV